jgi:hypothetical protein
MTNSEIYFKLLKILKDIKIRGYKYYSQNESWGY